MGDLFTPRQLLALNTFSDLVREAIDKCRNDAIAEGFANDFVGLENDGSGARAYAEAVGVYLAFAVDRSANYWSLLTPWGGDFIVQTFGRPAIPMVWDHAEANPMSNETGNWAGVIDWIYKALVVTVPGYGIGQVKHADAQSQSISWDKVISTDPPYYDNIGCADLSDFFYVWLRRSLKSVFPRLYATLVVPKDEELIAAPYRHGSRRAAEAFFLEGMGPRDAWIGNPGSLAFPVTIYYAFKQTDSKVTGETSSTGWETFLDAVLKPAFL